MSTTLKLDSKLAEQYCIPCTSETPALTQDQVNTLMSRLEGWELRDKVIVKSVTLTNFHQTMSFVNAIAWIANQEDHHPELTISYNKCKIEYTTHAVNGLSGNDFICAAKIDALLTV
jgi:4a-hydroxytetrahydrobiopterin dehydratase